jgi:phenylacetate-CoA ligase
MASLAAVVLPAYERLTGRRFWTMHRDLRRVQWESRETLEARALDRLRALVGHAVRHVPHYREVARREGLEPGDLRAITDLGLLAPLDRAALGAAATMGLEADDIPTARRRRVRTSGSTGEPIEFSRDPAELDPQWASLLLFQDWAEVALSDVRIVIAGRAPANADLARWTRVPAWARHGLLGSRTLSLPGVDASAERLRRLTGRLPAGRRYHIVAYPSYAARLAQEILDGGPAPRRSPSVVICGGETLAAGEADLIARAFRCPVVSRYSAWEATFMAQTCPDHPALLHINTERALIRIVRDDGREVAPGEPGRVLVTNLWNRVTPLINYDIGDWATAGDPCPCGRGFPTLRGVEGRAAEVIRTPGGTVISSAALCNFLTFEHPVLGTVAEFQAVQTAADVVLLRVVPTVRFTAASGLELTRAFGAFLGAGTEVHVRPVERIPTLPSGKRRLIEGLPRA